MLRDGSTAITGRQQLAQGSWVHQCSAGSGTDGYWKICEIKVTGLYCDQPIEITYTQRGQRQTCHLYIRFMPVGTSTPVVESLTYRGTTSGAYSVTNGSTTSIYVKKYEAYDQLGILEFLKDSYNLFTVTWKNEFVSSLPSGYKTATQVFSPGTANTAQVLTGYTFSSANGTNLSGTMANRGKLNWSPGGSTSYAVPAGYYSGGTLNSSSAYNSGYNNGVNAGKQTMGSTLQYVHSVSMGQNDPYYGSYTAASAGYYLVIACAAGTGDGNKKRTITISTTGTSRSYVRYWISSNGYSTTQTGCRQAVGVMICYMNSGNTVSYMLDTDYNTTEFCIIFKLG